MCPVCRRTWNQANFRKITPQRTSTPHYRCVPCGRVWWQDGEGVWQTVMPVIVDMELMYELPRGRR